MSGRWQDHRSASRGTWVATQCTFDIAGSIASLRADSTRPAWLSDDWNDKPSRNEPATRSTPASTSLPLRWASLLKPVRTGHCLTRMATALILPQGSIPKVLARASIGVKVQRCARPPWFFLAKMMANCSPSRRKRPTSHPILFGFPHVLYYTPGHSRLVLSHTELWKYKEGSMSLFPVLFLPLMYLVYVVNAIPYTCSNECWKLKSGAAGEPLRVDRPKCSLALYFPQPPSKHQQQSLAKTKSQTAGEKPSATMSLATSIFDSLFQPGLNTPTRNIMNFAFFGLFITLGALAILTHGNGHVLALFAISVALFASVQW